MDNQALSPPKDQPTDYTIFPQILPKVQVEEK
jgi:hypothetical protein